MAGSDPGDLFKPRRQYSSPDAREEAVHHINDDSALLEIARNESEPRVIKAALRNIKDKALLREAVFSGLPWKVFHELLLILFDSASMAEVISKTDDEEILFLIACRGGRSDRCNVLEKDFGEEFLARLAMETFSDSVFKRFFETVTDDTLRNKVLSECMGSLFYDQLKDIKACPFCHSAITWREDNYNKRKRDPGDSFFHETQPIVTQEIKYTVSCKGCGRILAEGDTAYESYFEIRNKENNT